MRSLRLVAICVATVVNATVAKADFIDLGGPATGYLAVSNFKNDFTQNGIEGKDGSGVFDPNHNGLPEYPNYEIPAGFSNAERFSAIIVSPQSTTADYAMDFSNAIHGGAPLTVNNQTITQPDASTLSAGRIDFDSGSVSPIGPDAISVNELIVDFNTFEWDGTVTPAQTGDPRSQFPLPGDPATPVNVSPFSPIFTPYNDAGGAGNAQLYYQISIGNLGGSGLAFLDGELTSMDITGDITISVFLGQAPAFGSADFAGSFSATGLSYEFDVAGTESGSIFSDLNLLMNRSGAVTVIPEPSSLLLSCLGMAAVARFRRRQ